VGPSPQGGGPTPILALRAFPHLVRDGQTPRSYITERERETLRLAANGHTNRSIAREMGLTEDTVKTRMVKLRRKLRAQDRAHAVAVALVLGVLSVDDVLVPPGANRGYRDPN
jgi:DNA-binding CsgD family transcriptional regulator